MEKHLRSIHESICEECYYFARNKQDLREHVELKHMKKCESCDEIFAGIGKLSKHMCRVHVINPDWGDFYMKNWYIRNECIRIFSKLKETEIGILHSESCIKSKPCTLLPSKLQEGGLRYVQEDLFVHVAASIFISEGKVKWSNLSQNLMT